MRMIINLNISMINLMKICTWTWTLMTIIQKVFISINTVPQMEFQALQAILSRIYNMYIKRLNHCI